MQLIVCVDDDFGMLFHHRRQSQDWEVRKNIRNLTQENTLWMNDYSKKQFQQEDTSHMRFDDNFLSMAQSGEFCFVETDDIVPYEDKIESIILYKWNRTYPSDTKFPLDLSAWNLHSVTEFIGSSHEKITQEIYYK